ncbi:pentatricopeptide repeat-containing protein, partial [Tanacetum coccineum]
VLNACSRGGLVEEGWKYFESMKSMHEIEPKIEHYGCLIDLLARAGLLKEAERKVNRIPKEKDDILVPVYGALLSACRLYGDVGMGEHLADRLMKIQVGDSSIHTILANIYASVGRWEDVKKNSYDDDEVLYLWSGWKNGQVSETMYEIAKFKFSRNVDFTDIHGMMNIGLTSRNVTSWIVVELSNATGNSVVIKGCFGHYQQVLAELEPYVTLAEKLDRLSAGGSGRKSVKVTYASTRASDYLDNQLLRAMIAKGVRMSSNRK